MAKSTWDVVPPNAAATWPLWKSSAEAMPLSGMSRCVCTSMPPGRRYVPPPSTTVAPSAGRSGAIAAIRSPSTSRSAGNVLSGVTTVPCLNSVRMSTCREAAAGRSASPWLPLIEKPGAVSDYGPTVGAGHQFYARCWAPADAVTRETGWAARKRILAGNDLVDGAAVVDDVEFTCLVFSEGTDPQVGRQQCLHHPATAAFTQRPQCTAAVIAEDVAPDQGADACAAGDGATGDRTASFASVLGDGQD